MKMEKIKVQITKIKDNAKIPSYAHKGDTGMDLYSTEDYTIKPGERVLVSTGIKIALPNGFEAQVRAKSGLALKYGLTVLNAPGTIDSEYRGEVGVITINLGQETYEVKAGEKIAQLVIKNVCEAELEELDNLDDTTRGDGGFGSTGLE